MKAIIFTVLLALAACGTGEPLPPIEGTWYALNPERWQPTPADQQVISRLPER